MTSLLRVEFCQKKERERGKARPKTLDSIRHMITSPLLTSPYYRTAVIILDIVFMLLRCCWVDDLLSLLPCRRKTGQCVNECCSDVALTSLPQEVIKTQIVRVELLHARISDLIGNLIDEILDELAVHIITVTVEKVDEEEVKVDLAFQVVAADAIQKKILKAESLVFQCKKVCLNQGLALRGGLRLPGRNVVQPMDEDGEGSDEMSVEMIIRFDGFRIILVCRCGVSSGGRPFRGGDANGGFRCVIVSAWGALRLESGLEIRLFAWDLAGSAIWLSVDIEKFGLGLEESFVNVESCFLWSNRKDQDL